MAKSKKQTEYIVRVREVHELDLIITAKDKTTAVLDIADGSGEPCMPHYIVQRTVLSVKEND